MDRGVSESCGKKRADEVGEWRDAVHENPEAGEVSKMYEDPMPQLSAFVTNLHTYCLTASYPEKIRLIEKRMTAMMPPISALSTPEITILVNVVPNIMNVHMRRNIKPPR